MHHVTEHMLRKNVFPSSSHHQLTISPYLEEGLPHHIPLLTLGFCLVLSLAGLVHTVTTAMILKCSFSACAENSCYSHLPPL